VLRTRVQTAVALGAPLIACLLFAPAAFVAVVFAAFIVLGAWEWARLGGLAGRAALAYAAGTAAALGVAYRHLGAPGAVVASMAIAFLWWCVVIAGLVWVQCRPPAPRPAAGLRLLSGWLVLLPPWLALVFLVVGVADGRHWALGLLVLIWLADSAAYLGGRRYGRRRLASRVSPGKSWEGLVAALAAVAAASAAWVGLRADRDGPDWELVALCLVTALASVAGDLLESQIKRWAGAKDSSGLLPGHGGVLDRIDSLTAAAPVFVGGLLFLGIV
jgi:phosphatidate cytidylyltransferase